MQLITKLISGYPSGDVSPQDFIDHLTIGADGWVAMEVFCLPVFCHPRTGGISENCKFDTKITA
jgi:hypothetical protein